jgi:dienelactone hydrolase
MHDAHGIGSLVRRRSLELAAQGYVAFAPDMYGGGRRFENAREAGELLQALYEKPQRLRDRVLAAFEVLKRQSQTDESRIGALGFCFGGQCVLELARSGAAVKAVVSFHGLLKTQMPAEPGVVKAKVLALTGKQDPYAPAADVESFQKEMEAAQVDLHLTVYGRGYHAFSEPEAVQMTLIPGVRYDPVLAKLSWSQGTAFIEAVIEE